MLSGLTARVRSLWNAIRRRADVEAEMAAEFRTHMELRTSDLVRWGLTPAEAARQARLEFGSLERYKDEARASRGLDRINDLRISWLDFKLGFRMLARYPGLTIVGGLAMAFAIWIGASTFEIMTQAMAPSLPLPGGDRIVGPYLRDLASGEREPRALYDFVAWRGELRTIEDFGATRRVRRNLITDDGVGEPVEIAEISASAFRVTRVPPLLGRTLVDADEAAGAAPVVVIGEELWQSRFGRDPNIIGRGVRLGANPATIVGVMPASYRFPRNHQFWAPLRTDAMSFGPRDGPGILMFGRLAPGASLDEARSELAVVFKRAAAPTPKTHERLRPDISPYALSVLPMEGWEKAALTAFNVPFLLLITLICGNVALLIFARAATRESELAVRTALGASRARIIMQLFAEALVLGGFAAVVGLLAAGPAVGWAMRVAEVDMMSGNQFPFWFHGSLSPATVLYTVVLTVFTAIIAGVVPAVKMTRGMSKLQQASAGGGGVKLGGLWTAVIIAQVAVTVAFPGITFLVQRSGATTRVLDAGFTANEYLGARIEMDRDLPPGADGDTSEAAFNRRYSTTVEEVKRRLAADPAVAGATFATTLPRMSHPARYIELDEGGAAPIDPRYPDGHRVSVASVDPGFFQAFGAPVIAGRAFNGGDLQPGVTPVIVNESFVRRVLEGRNAIGRRLRYASWGETIPQEKRGPWYEIVGVVPDLGMDTRPDDPKVAGFYHPATGAAMYPAEVAVHVKGRADAFVPRFRAIVAEVDPTLRVYDVQRLDRVVLGSVQGMVFWFRLFAGISAMALLLSLAGIYAVMSFTVSRRTREIGIRVALGASRSRIVTAIFRRPLIQVAIGVLVGSTLVMFIVWGESGRDVLSAKQAVFVIAYALGMMAVCLLACVVPTRRALGVEPTEALRGDG
jgi:predicted permease